MKETKKLTGTRTSLQWEKEMEYRKENITNLFHVYSKIYLDNMLIYKIRNVFKANKSKTVLDFGAGNGRYTIPLAFFGYNVDALDCSKNMIRTLLENKNSIEKLTGKKLNIKTIKTDILDYKTTKRYDAIFSVGVMEHFLDYNERMDIIEKQSKLLRKKGIIITIVPLKKYLKCVIPFRNYTKERFNSDFSKFGLKVKYVEGFNLYGHLLNKPADNIVIKMLNKSVYYFFRMTSFIYTQNFKYKHSSTIICVAEKK